MCALCMCVGMAVYLCLCLCLREEKQSGGSECKSVNAASFSQICITNSVPIELAFAAQVFPLSSTCWALLQCFHLMLRLFDFHRFSLINHLIKLGLDLLCPNRRTESIKKNAWEIKSADTPIDRPVIGIGRFLAWPARISDRPVSLTSCRFDPILLLPAAQAETSQPRVHSQYDITVVCKHVVFAWEWI